MSHFWTLEALPKGKYDVTTFEEFTKKHLAIDRLLFPERRQYIQRIAADGPVLVED